MAEDYSQERRKRADLDSELAVMRQELEHAQRGREEEGCKNNYRMNTIFMITACGRPCGVGCAEVPTVKKSIQKMF